jgi:hypothetical protein
MRTTIALTWVLALAVAHAASRTVDFSQDTIDQPPKGFEFGQTAGVGRPGRWVVQTDGSNRVLAQTDADSTRSQFPVAVLSDLTTTNLDLSVRFKPISVRVDQAAGLVWRYQSQENYDSDLRVASTQRFGALTSSSDEGRVDCSATAEDLHRCADAILEVR